MRISDWSSDVCSSDLKDRLSCLAVTRALDVGATMIVAASSGNGGASLALYAAAAGLQSCIVTTSALSPVFRRAIIMKIGRSHVLTPVTNPPLVCRLLLEKKKLNTTTNYTALTD